MASFLERFGGSKANVNYDAQATSSGVPLEMPSSDDTLEAIEAKLAALARVVLDGNSVAVATGYTGAAHTVRDPVQLARMSMTPMEIDMLDAHNDGLSLPEIDWQRCVDEMPTGEKARQRMERRAAALRGIYQNPAIVAGNAVWFTKNHEFMLPLVIAIAKVQAASRELGGGQTELSEMEMAEVQTIHKANAIGLQVVNDMFRQLNAMVRKINSSKDTLQAREHALKDKMADRKPKQSIANKYREAAGRAPITGEVNFRAGTGGGRVERPSLLAGTGLGQGSAPTRTPRAGPRPSTAAPPAQSSAEMEY
uniref:Uncharacterized protein n=1 Tax=Plasmopara viticola lesion associated bipartite mycovirus 1 TaxID=2689384 RepID=A0A6B9KHC6_9VIRU|nr:hypothetical protein [Plasmopara viticola lesion associated bipartite mycovirus 1]